MTTLTRWLMLEERSASCDEKTKMIYIIRIAGIKSAEVLKDIPDPVVRTSGEEVSGTVLFDHQTLFVTEIIGDESIAIFYF